MHRFGMGMQIITPREMEILAIKRAMAEYGLSEAEVLDIPIARYNQCHGNLES
jgi:hypothetical protein